MLGSLSFANSTSIVSIDRRGKDSPQSQSSRPIYLALQQRSLLASRVSTSGPLPIRVQVRVRCGRSMIVLSSKPRILMAVEQEPSVCERLDVINTFSHFHKILIPVDLYTTVISYNLSVRNDRWPPKLPNGETTSIQCRVDCHYY